MDISALFKITHGVYLIGVKDPDGRLCGCIVDALLQATYTPLGIELCTNKNTYTTECIRNSREFTVSILPENADPKIIAKFGLNSSRDCNKWENIDYNLLEGLPTLKDCLSTFKVKVFHELELSTHILWSCEVVATEDIHSGTPMTYGFYREHIADLAKRAQNGEDVQPYTEEKSLKIPENTPKYVCGVCGYAYEGDIPFEDLPDDWTCPNCGMKKEVFSKI
jgi:flavin reductase (DIM6/NTAB) family NADH-FMN oxidoreductase RutF/rubredoxin